MFAWLFRKRKEPLRPIVEVRLLLHACLPYYTSLRTRQSIEPSITAEHKQGKGLNSANCEYRTYTKALA